MSDNINLMRLGYRSIAAASIAGTLMGCEFCIPLLAAMGALALIRNAANGFSTHAVKPV